MAKPVYVNEVVDYIREVFFLTGEKITPEAIRAIDELALLPDPRDEEVIEHAGDLILANLMSGMLAGGDPLEAMINKLERRLHDAGSS